MGQLVDQGNLRHLDVTMLLHALHESSGEPMWTGGLGGEGDGAACFSRVKRQKKMMKGGSGGSFMFGGERKGGRGVVLCGTTR
jgi:hypothetical protein